MEIERKKFEQLKAAGELPSPKGAALAIVRLAQMNDGSILSFEPAIKSDLAFVGRLMKAANITSAIVAGRRSRCRLRSMFCAFP